MLFYNVFIGRKEIIGLAEKLLRTFDAAGGSRYVALMINALFVVVN